MSGVHCSVYSSPVPATALCNGYCRICPVRARHYGRASGGLGWRAGGRRRERRLSHAEDDERGRIRAFYASRRNPHRTRTRDVICRRPSPRSSSPPPDAPDGPCDLRQTGRPTGADQTERAGRDGRSAMTGEAVVQAAMQGTAITMWRRRPPPRHADWLPCLGTSQDKAGDSTADSTTHRATVHRPEGGARRTS